MLMLEGKTCSLRRAFTSIPLRVPWSGIFLSSIGFLGGREGKDRNICYDEEMNVSLIMKEKACVLPRSIIVMGAGSVNGLRAFEQSAGARVSALECRNSLDRQ